MFVRDKRIYFKFWFTKNLSFGMGMEVRFEMPDFNRRISCQLLENVVAFKARVRMSGKRNYSSVVCIWIHKGGSYET